MTDIYTPEGVLDYAEAARSLAGIKGVTNHLINAQTVSRVQAAAMLDIAVSLNRLTVLAEGAEFPLGSDAPDEREVGPDGEPLVEPERGDDEPPLEVGDWIAPRSAAGGPLKGFDPVQITRLGESEGDVWVEVHSDDADLGRMWAANLVRVDPPRETDAEGYDLDTPDADEDDDEPTGADMVDELDADFDTPPADTAPAERERCGVAHPDIEGVTCARKLTVDGTHAGKHRKGNLKWV